MHDADEEVPADLPVIDDRSLTRLRDGYGARNKTDDAAWAAQLQLLTAAADVSEELRRPRLAADAQRPLSGLPELRLLALTPWDRWLTGARVLLVSRGPALYVVWSGPPPADGFRLRLDHRPLELEPVLPPGRVLLDPRLDPIEGERFAWRARDVDGRDLLAPGRLVEISGIDAWERHLPPIQLRRAELEGEAPPVEPGGQLPPSSVQRLVVRAIRAYTSDTPEDFRAAVARLTEDGRGRGERPLYRWQSTWLGAMVAELRRLPVGARGAWGVKDFST